MKIFGLIAFAAFAASPAVAAYAELPTTDDAAVTTEAHEDGEQQDHEHYAGCICGWCIDPFSQQA